MCLLKAQCLFGLRESGRPELTWVQDSNPVSLHHRAAPQTLREDHPLWDVPSPRGKGIALLFERETLQRNTTPGGTGGV